MFMVIRKDESNKFILEEKELRDIIEKAISDYSSFVKEEIKEIKINTSIDFSDPTEMNTVKKEQIIDDAISSGMKNISSFEVIK